MLSRSSLLLSVLVVMLLPVVTGHPLLISDGWYHSGDKIFLGEKEYTIIVHNNLDRVLLQPGVVISKGSCQPADEYRVCVHNITADNGVRNTSLGIFYNMPYVNMSRSVSEIVGYPFETSSFELNFSNIGFVSTNVIFTETYQQYHGISTSSPCTVHENQLRLQQVMHPGNQATCYVSVTPKKGGSYAIAGNAVYTGTSSNSPTLQFSVNDPLSMSLSSDDAKVNITVGLRSTKLVLDVENLIGENIPVQIKISSNSTTKLVSAIPFMLENDALVHEFLLSGEDERNFTIKVYNNVHELVNYSVQLRYFLNNEWLTMSDGVLVNYVHDYYPGFCHETLEELGPNGKPLDVFFDDAYGGDVYPLLNANINVSVWNRIVDEPIFDVRFNLYVDGELQDVVVVDYLDTCQRVRIPSWDVQETVEGRSTLIEVKGSYVVAGQQHVIDEQYTVTQQSSSLLSIKPSMPDTVQQGGVIQRSVEIGTPFSFPVQIHIVDDINDLSYRGVREKFVTINGTLENALSYALMVPRDYPLGVYPVTTTATYFHEGQAYTTIFQDEIEVVPFQHDIQVEGIVQGVVGDIVEAKLSINNKDDVHLEDVWLHLPYHGGVDVSEPSVDFGNVPSLIKKSSTTLVRVIDSNVTEIVNPIITYVVAGEEFTMLAPDIFVDMTTPSDVQRVGLNLGASIEFNEEQGVYMTELTITNLDPAHHAITLPFVDVITISTDDLMIDLRSRSTKTITYVTLDHDVSLWEEGISYSYEGVRFHTGYTLPTTFSTISLPVEEILVVEQPSQVAPPPVDDIPQIIIGGQNGGMSLPLWPFVLLAIGLVLLGVAYFLRRYR